METAGLLAGTISFRKTFMIHIKMLRNQEATVEYLEIVPIKPRTGTALNQPIFSARPKMIQGKEQYKLILNRWMGRSAPLIKFKKKLTKRWSN